MSRVERCLMPPHRPGLTKDIWCHEKVQLFSQLADHKTQGLRTVSLVPEDGRSDIATRVYAGYMGKHAHFGEGET